jgi:DNA-binding Lrp family transcriptional regulator
MADMILDDLDRGIISMLRANGREPVATLARRLGVTRTTINHRLDRLVERGVIVGFSVRVRDVAESSAVRAIMLVAVESRSIDDVIRDLRGVPEVAALHSTNGRWDLVAELSCESLSSFDQVLTTIRKIKGIQHTETNILLSSATR